MEKKLDFAFFGTPEVAGQTLEILKQAGFLPALVVTSPDARAGRKMLMTPPPAKVWAIANNISYIQPEKLSREEFKNGFDLFIVVAYGQIIPEEILNLPRLGSINVHYSLLPKYRGASPVESAILNGDAETGVSIQKMVYKMDAGPVIAQEKTAILPSETAPELRARLIKIGGDMLVKMFNTPSASGTSPYIGGGWVGVNQNESQATFCHKIKKEDGLINLNDDARKNYNKFRAYAAWPRIYFFQNNKRIIITDATLENDKFVIKKIVPENGKEMDYRN